MLDWIDSVIASDGRASVTPAAVNLVMSAREQPETMRAVLSATLAVPDGMPLVWALHALGNPAATRVYGPDLMALSCERAAREGTPIYLYGGRSEEALELLAARLGQRFPGLVIAGRQTAPFRVLTPAERERAVAAIDGSGAKIVWIGIGQPQQEQWMADMRPHLAAPVLVAVGAAFDFHAGLVAQAPPWMQQRGLEWLFRLSREPRRLWRRYARYNPMFVAAFARQYARHRLGAKP